MDIRLHPPLTDALPAPIRKGEDLIDPAVWKLTEVSACVCVCVSVLNEACRRSHSAGGLLSHMTNFLPTNMTSQLHLSSLEPVRSAYSLAQR